MDKMKTAVRTRVVRWIKRWNFSIVVIFSILHIGVAYFHDRDSG